MKRIGRIALGLAMVTMLFVWLVYRHHEPFNGWATSGKLVGWAFQGAAWLSCLGGAYLMAIAWPAKPQRTSSSAEADDYVVVCVERECSGQQREEPSRHARYP